MIQLQGYILNQSNEAIHLTLYWRALAAGQVDYTRFVHLIAPLTEQVMTQSDGLPDHGTYPTDQWTAGEVVADSVTLDLTAVPPGQYKIGLGFYRYLDDSSFPRLAAVDDQGHPLPFDRALLPIPIAIEK
jgi:hypothetical protein